MYLEKIEIQGFKSFAKKTTLKFSDKNKKSTQANGRAGKDGIGLTVVVGPNGSGKSNIADAVRWVLGEQSTKLLRGKKGEDVIFSGSVKKASLSFAEVSLHLNNEDKQAKIDYTELVITRRLYRNGESEYLINNSKVRLLDVSMLLAKAHFAQRAYSVIGQGMVDTFLNTSPAERKEFFDEATGVKMYQIKKHEANLKLNGAQGNLSQAVTLLEEIEPRMRSLTRQIKKLEQRVAIESQLHDVQKNYYAGEWHKLNKELKEINQQVVEHEGNQREQEKELNKISTSLNGLEREQFQNEIKEKLEVQIKSLQNERNLIMQSLAEVKAQKSVSLELSGQTDIAWLDKKNDQLKEDINKYQAELQEVESKQTEANKRVVAIRQKQSVIDDQIINARKQIMSQRNHGSGDADNIVHQIKINIDELINAHQDIFSLLEQGKDLAIIKKEFSNLYQKIKELKNIAHQKQIKSDDDLQKLNSEIINLEEEKNKLTQQYVEAQTQASAMQSKSEYLKIDIKSKQAERDSIKQKLNKQTDSSKNSNKELDRKQKVLEHDLESKEEKINKIEKELKEIFEQEKRQRDQIIELQKKAHQLQNEYNEVLNKLSEVKVIKARVETKLEDLEQEIRNETNNLRAIIDCKNYKKIEKSEAREEIKKLKHKLEQIGGIDPEIQKEYEETKERYEFLSKQVNDLSSAISSLQKLIVGLDKTIAEKFDKAFVEIAKQFEKYFKVLFDGGNVKLEKVYEEANKVEEENVEDSEEDESKKETLPTARAGKVVLRETKKELVGIDVMATPPNKKIKNISMLSGGERALTAIALISAIIAVNPSPFVMLDEVDAALDEANSIRLSRILEDLSKKTQFIAITHNRTIMYKADILYGVTMGNDGVSKLLSVKVDELKGSRR